MTELFSENSLSHSTEADAGLVLNHSKYFEYFGSVGHIIHCSKARHQ